MLAECAESDPPDYFRFQSWFAEQSTSAGVSPETILSPRALPSSGGLISELLTRAVALRARLRASSSEVDAGTFKRYKLLHSVLAKRGREFVAALDGPLPADFDYTTASSAQLRVNLFAALERTDTRAISRALGAIEQRGTDHDPGELSYLAALSSLYLGDFADAVRHASKVPVGSPDLPRARHVSLMARAKAGDATGLMESLDEFDHSKLSLAQMMLLWLLIARLEAVPDADLERLDELCRAREVLDPTQDPGQGELVEEIAQSTADLTQQLQELRLSLSAAEDQRPLTDALFSHLMNDPALRALARALAPFVSIEELVNLIAAGDSAWPLLAPLFTTVANPPPSTFLVACECMSRMEAYEQLVGSFEPIHAQLEKALPEKILFLERLAFEAHLHLGDELSARRVADRMRARGVSAPETPLSTSWILQADPMALLALESAEFELQAAIAANRRWRDAGMNSLGYFRVLERVLSHQLVTPALRTVSPDFLKASVAALDEKRGKEWEPLLKAIGGVLSGKQPGLELGPMEVLLGRVRRLGDAADKQLREVLRLGIIGKLTASGVDALDKGEFAKLIAQDVRDQFRNAPAHGRFVAISEVHRCRAHVSSALTQLAVWLVRPAS
jgi:hypothetical protein